MSARTDLIHEAQHLVTLMRIMSSDLADQPHTVISAKLARSLILEAAQLAGVAAAMMVARDES